MTYRDWMEAHGERVAALVAATLPDEPPREVEAITAEVLVRAAYGSEEGRVPLGHPDAPAWVEALTRRVCQHVAALDVRPWAFDWDAYYLHGEETRRAEWERLERHYPTGDPTTDRYVERRRGWFGLGAPVALLIPRRVRAVLADAMRSAQDRIAGSGAAAVGELGAWLPAAPAIRHAAATVGAVVGLVVPAAAASPGLPPASAPGASEQVVAMELAAAKASANTGPTSARPHDDEPPEATATHSPGGAIAPAPASAPAADPVPAGEETAPPVERASSATTVPASVEPGASPPLPSSPSKPSARVQPPDDEPVGEQEHEDGTRYGTPHIQPVTIDYDGDGEDDGAVGAPYAGWDCPRPEERGPGSAVVCPVLDESEVLDEESGDET